MSRFVRGCSGCRPALVLAGMVFLSVTTSGMAAELRGFWVDAWGAGFHSQSEVETLLGRVGSSTNIGQLRETNCNAVFVQVRRRADTCYPSAVGEPYMSGLSPSNYNALQAIINSAHDTTGGKQRIEVHAWIVVFKTSASSPVYLAHNNPANSDNYWITRTSGGSEATDYPLDPGHPRVQEYITDVCMDLVNNYNIDGLHYDYIRFGGQTEGYNPTSLARYNTWNNLSGTPSATDSLFQQWRRDQVSAVVRRVYAHAQKNKPQVKVSGALITWAPSPTTTTRSSFMATRPYYEIYSDWDAWMQEGILDLSVTMNYFDQSSRPTDYTRWMNFQKDRKFDRQTVVGPGIYMNSLSNAILQLQQTRNASPAGNHAEGFCGYSYRVPYSGGSWSGFAPTFKSQVTPSPTTIPGMPWKTNPTKGHLMGTVTAFATGAWLDGATVSITGSANRTMRCDGTGFYAFIDLPPGNYSVTVSMSGYPNGVASVAVSAGQMTERDFALGGNPGPQISNVQATSITNNSATITWLTSQAATSQVEYGPTGSYGSMTPVDSSLVTNHSMTLTGLSQNTLYHYRARSSNTNGSTNSSDFTFTTNGPPQISSIQVTGITPNGATITWTTNAPATTQVRYGLTSGYGSQTVLNPALVTNHSATLTGLSISTLYHYQVVSGNAFGTAQSGDLTFQTSGAPIISNVLATTITALSATILWNTDVTADTQVEYGQTVSYGNTTPLDATPRTAHSVLLSALQPGTLYHYRVRSGNAAGVVFSTDRTFNTILDVPDVVIDNLDAGWANTSPSGSWSSGSLATVPKIGTNYLFTAGTGDPSEASATRMCTWTPNLPIGGIYDVYAFFQVGTNRTTGAPYKVFYNGGQSTSAQNQYSTTPNQGDWVRIGQDLPFQAGTAGYVQLSNNTPDTGFVSADAVKLVYKGGADFTPPMTPVVTDDGLYTHLLTELHASWSAGDPETGIKKYEYRIVEQGGPQIQAWTDAAAATQATATGLSLTVGKTYVFEVRATNNADLVSSVGASNGITIFRFDMDSNGYIDTLDTEIFIMCLSGAAIPYETPLGIECDRFDHDDDGDVDIADFGAYQRCLSGNLPVDLNCLGQ